MGALPRGTNVKCIGGTGTKYICKRCIYAHEGLQPKAK